MYKLYYSPGACSLAVHVLLNELGVKYEAVAAGDKAGAEFLKLNPQGAVPVLVIDDNYALLEGAAIITYLCDTHKSPLLPASGIERAKALQWLAFANATLHPAYGRGFAVLKRWKFSTEDERQSVLKQVVEGIQKLWDNVEKHLEANGPYLAGSQITAGDILISVIANWAALGKVNFGPKTKALLKDASSRPAYQQALKAEQVEYKAAA